MSNQSFDIKKNYRSNASVARVLSIIIYYTNRYARQVWELSICIKLFKNYKRRAFACKPGIKR